MRHQISCSTTKLSKAMNPEQFNQIEEAILDGKYSWACVLLLRFAGYNPLHYIPYRTYNRLQKENCQNGRAIAQKADSIKASNQATANRSSSMFDEKSLDKIADLNYLEVIGEKNNSLRGGYQEQWVSERLEEDSSITWNLTPLSSKNSLFVSGAVRII